jgi:hypothetical protein
VTSVTKIRHGYPKKLLDVQPAWAQLVNRKGHHGADLTVSNERLARELEAA